ncbi:MAG: NUDIX domain-containing protein, partial [Hyphomicrobiaceae bacterium]|nr:NUDIX domain-containing protein [Hyphomicrobiaceae bacterium]
MPLIFDSRSGSPFDVSRRLQNFLPEGPYRPLRRHRQIAALPYRRRDDGVFEVCLVTSRDTGRWVLPKGWPMRGRTNWEAAAREAYEEAGLVGEIEKSPVGRFPYWKRM